MRCRIFPTLAHLAYPIASVLHPCLVRLKRLQRKTSAVDTETRNASRSDRHAPQTPSCSPVAPPIRPQNPTNLRNQIGPSSTFELIQVEATMWETGEHDISRQGGAPVQVLPTSRPTVIVGAHHAWEPEVRIAEALLVVS
ncbi:hypothetical protein K456DRAFT_575015 [Colletotrichum gloeosporioides 23]|nr:hypothetical protein K456DRAFT_575015 [Colletotrichum gloeosporioides 23]